MKVVIKRMTADDCEIDLVCAPYKVSTLEIGEEDRELLCDDIKITGKIPEGTAEIIQQFLDGDIHYIIIEGVKAIARETKDKEDTVIIVF